MLEYESKQAPSERLIIQQSLRLGKPYPKAIADAPELDIDNRFYHRAFIDLTTCRLFELGPIPYLSVIKYCNHLRLSEEQSERLVDVIRIVDDWFIANEVAKIKKRNAHNGKRPKVSGTDNA